MGELLDFVTAASGKLGIPPEILTGLPVVEMTGDSAVLIEQHHGISAYSEEEVCVKVNLGTICVSGSGLTIRVMNHEKIIIYGRITSLRMERRAL